jgi:hypothetical protein
MGTFRLRVPLAEVVPGTYSGRGQRPRQVASSEIRTVACQKKALAPPSLVPLARAR